jgi:hypothetical protein
MAFFKRFLTPAAQASSPDLYKHDHVYPVHTLDDTPTMRSILITWTICFNDVLDAEKLQQSLASLLEIGDWRKLGGRLRLKVNQSLNSDCRSRILTSRSRRMESSKSMYHLGSQLSDPHSHTVMRMWVPLSRTMNWLRNSQDQMELCLPGLDLITSRTWLSDQTRQRLWQTCYCPTHPKFQSTSRLSRMPLSSDCHGPIH